MQGVEVGTTADFLAALEARANRRTAGDPPTRAHRQSPADCSRCLHLLEDLRACGPQ